MKVKFWVTSSRMTDLNDVVTVPKWLLERKDLMQELLEDWCKDVFPMFEYTDAFVNYGYDEKINQNSKVTYKWH